MKVFTDLHHGDLFHSLHKLFEERLGYELYRPIGLDWFKEGFWSIGDPYPDPLDTAEQYLTIRKGGWKMYVNINGDPYIEDEVYNIWNPIHKVYEKAITLEKFKEMEFDIIMPTFPGHERVYEKLRNLFQPKAKLISQLGNINQTSHLPNILHSVPYQPLNKQNTCFYHQEIDMDIYFHKAPSKETRNIYSLVNLLPYPEIYNQYKNSLKDINFKAYGVGTPEGTIYGTSRVAEKMREANLGWHVRWNESFGHTAMGWGAIGRMTVVKGSTLRYVGTKVPPLFVPGFNCIDIDAHTVHENEKLIRQALDPETQIKNSEKVLNYFKKAVDYDKDFENIKKFLNNLR